MTSKFSTALMLICLGLLTPLMVTGCGGDGENVAVPIDADFDSNAADAKAAEEEQWDSSTAAP